MHCTVLYCTILYCAVLHCTVLYSFVLYCTVLCCTVLYCAVLYGTVLCCAVLCSTILYCTVLCCTVLYCTVLCCRYYVAEGVRLYSQETWRLVTEQRGVQLVEKYITEVSGQVYCICIYIYTVYHNIQTVYCTCIS